MLKVAVDGHCDRHRLCALCKPNSGVTQTAKFIGPTASPDCAIAVQWPGVRTVWPQQGLR